MADGDPPPPSSPHEKVENLLSIIPLPKKSESLSSTHQFAAAPISEASNQIISGDFQLAAPSQVQTTLIGSLEIHLQTGTSSIEAKNVSSPPNQISCVSNPFESEPLHQGKPMVTFNLMEKSKLINGLNHVLIAKFSHRRPALAIIKSFFQSLNVKGLLNVSLFDSKHVVVECEHFDDFVLIWIKKFWTIDGSTARIFKWDADFHPSVESSITPIWIHLPCLPLFFYDEWTLLKIAKSIGRHLFVDKNNLNRRKLPYATICVEIDVSKPLIDQLWIRFVGKESKDIVEGYWQKVVYDIVPPYCSFCHHVGHRIGVCKRRVEQNEGKGASLFQNLEFRQDENRVKIKGKKVETDMISDQAVESDCDGVKYTPAVQNLGSSGSKSGVGDTPHQPKIDSAKLIQMPEQYSSGCIEEGEIREGPTQDSVAGDSTQVDHLLVGRSATEAGEFAAAGKICSAATFREAVVGIPGSAATEEFAAAGETGYAASSWEPAAGVTGSLPRSAAGTSSAVETGFAASSRERGAGVSGSSAAVAAATSRESAAGVQESSVAGIASAAATPDHGFGEHVAAGDLGNTIAAAGLGKIHVVADGGAVSKAKDAEGPAGWEPRVGEIHEGETVAQLGDGAVGIKTIVQELRLGSKGKDEKEEGGYLTPLSNRVVQDVTEENNEIGLVKKEMQKIGEAERVRKSTAQEETQLARELKFVRERKNLKEYFMASAEKINSDLKRKRSEKKEKTTRNSFKYGEG